MRDKEKISLVATIARYWGGVVPLARREIIYWYARAETIRDPVLRRIARSKITGEQSNIESAAFFGLLAGRDWSRAVRLVVAWQLAYELLDGIDERNPCLADGLRLHGALVEAVGGPCSNHGCGHYLQELVDTCRELARPSEELTAAAEEVGIAQARNHSGDGLQEWAEQFAPHLLWWESAAAGISSLGVLALLTTPPSEHGQVLRTYTEVRALSSLLDALVDDQADIHTVNHNWLRHYNSPRHAADRTMVLLKDARQALLPLHQEPLHRLILAGVVAHYLSIGSRHGDYACEIRPELMRAFPLATVGFLILKTHRSLRPPEDLSAFHRVVGVGLTRPYAQPALAHADSFG